jgi:CubicO group peptidase (beta-lactamase class C family)
MRFFAVLVACTALGADRKPAVDQIVQPLIDAKAAPGVVVGLLENGTTQIFAYGADVSDNVFEIGSITKTFTTTALAVMVDRKMVALDDPVRKLLPPGAVPAGEGDEIRLIDLATQTSGLPRLPGNMKPKDFTNPYADYSPQLLYAFLTQYSLKRNPEAKFLYSNLGMGLLGHALSLRYGKSYEQMIAELVTNPLKMSDTSITLSADQKKRLAPGHDVKGQVVPNWDLDALAGAGALRSTSSDLLRYVSAQIDPPQPMKSAIEMAHVSRADVGGGMRIALAWLIKPDGKTTWHNGGTGGYVSYASFNAERKSGVVVLINSTGRYADQIGDRMEHILAGEKADPVQLRKSGNN